MVECRYGKTHSPSTAFERRRTRATLPGGQRAQRAHLVAAALAARPGAYGDGTLCGHWLPGVLDRPDRQTLQRTGARRHAEPAAHHVLSPAPRVVAGAAGGTAGGAGGGRGTGRALDRRRRGGLDGPPPRPPGVPSTPPATSPAPQVPLAQSPP